MLDAAAAEAAAIGRDTNRPPLFENRPAPEWVLRKPPQHTRSPLILRDWGLGIEWIGDS